MVRFRYSSVRSHQPSSRASGKEFWQYELIGGLPEHFNYASIRSDKDAKDLILALPKSDRGRTARGLFEHRNEIDASSVYAGVMTAWAIDHRDVIEAFGSEKLFAAALRTIAPHGRTPSHTCAEIWRGALVHEFKLVAHAISISISWTRSRAIACWFALRDYVPALQPHLLPVVLRASITPSTIVAWHNTRAEQEVIIDPIDLARTSEIGIDGFGPSPIQRPLADLKIDGRKYHELIDTWRRASARYQHWKDLLETRRICARR